MPGNWKLEAIITVLAELGEATARDIEEKTSLGVRQVGQYIRYYMEGKYVTSHKIPAHDDSHAPWVKLYSLTEVGMDRYRRLYDG